VGAGSPVAAPRRLHAHIEARLRRSLPNNRYIDRAVRDHLVAREQQDLGEWIRDLPPENLGDFLADMEVTARQADADSDIGSFISALADWQTTAEASRNGWAAD
jgi:hypothetical protein